ncbi:hypothetical protein GT037_006299 [Alternaria burnsii]|uniref:Uncharacterized protein n=1 Tax=Alternaria burnsii TaxID=1187904 RepID=A0A8H7B6Q4_9PLEO|nr:uncharacterized protein GT037_006299 [Alternaria burnsii]KAF7675580.1 hypothetical protein GT037_006299 [Alternaria burnsii]
MHDAIIPLVVTVATVALASPIAEPAATRMSVAATTTSGLFSGGVTTSVPDHDQTHHKTDFAQFEQEDAFSSSRGAQRQQQETEDFHYYYSEASANEKGPSQSAWKDHRGMTEKTDWNRLAEKRDGKRKHGVVCSIL